jgi:hypothetical protein
VVARPLYWTAADEAEVELVAEALVEAAFAHRERCSACRTTGTSCDELRDAIAAAVRWAQRRHRRSRATYLAAAELARLEELRARAGALLGHAVRLPRRT